MDVEEFREDVRSGRIDADQRVELIVTFDRQMQQARPQIEQLEKKLDDLRRARGSVSISSELPPDRRTPRHRAADRQMIRAGEMHLRYPLSPVHGKLTCGRWDL